VADLPGKIEIARILASLPRVDTGALAGVTVRAWLDGAVRVPSARGVVEMLLRISSYTADFDRLSAGAGLGQLQIALAHNVRYVDGGWQALVEGLRRVGEAAGVAFVSGVRAEQVVVEDGAVRGVRLAGGREIPARAVVLAVSPGAAADLAPSAPELAAHAAAATPVRAACLDLGLSRLPVRRALAAFGVDRPLYLSVHSAAARLCPEGSALVHLAMYLGGPGGDGDPERELEALMDKVQPGWREVVVERRFLPSLVVMNDLVDGGGGGWGGWRGVLVGGVRGLYLAGDWVGPEGMLADASLASASTVARALGEARHEGARPRREGRGLHEVAPS
jgi:phytoene dehydrogenase-like protein